MISNSYRTHTYVMPLEASYNDDCHFIYTGGTVTLGVIPISVYSIHRLNNNPRE